MNSKVVINGIEVDFSDPFRTGRTDAKPAAASVATINGVRVFSTKQVQDILNTKVTFTDGSWCDVATSQVVNNGPGSISLGVPGSGAQAERKTTERQVFKGNAVEVRGVLANLDIQVGETVSLVVEGPADEVDSIRATQEGDTLLIVGSGATGNAVFSASNITITSGSYTSIQTSSRSQSPGTTIRITVPKGAAVSARDVFGATTIGDTEGPVTLTASGMQTMSAGRVGAANLTASGQGEIVVKSVSTRLTSACSGQSDLKVKGGEVAELVMSASGQSEACFRGKATNGTLNSSGQSSIRVDHVQNRPSRNSSGQSEIEVENWD